MIGDELLRYFMISKATTRRWRERNRQADRQPDSRKARHTDSQTARQTGRKYSFIRRCRYALSD